MATIKVTYGGLVRNLLDSPGEEMVFDREIRLRDLLDELAKKHGDSFRFSLFTSRGELRPLVRVMINGESPETTGGLSAILGKSEEVSIFLMGDAAEGG